MSLSQLSRNVMMGRRAKARMEKAGVTPRGSKLWTPEELEVVRRLYPDYDEMTKVLPGRTRVSVIGAAAKLGIRRSIKIWTAAEVSLLRKMYPSASVEDIRAAFPDAEWINIQQVARYHGYRRKKRPYKVTGHPGIDQVRHRCFEIKWTMRDLDAAAGTKNYFSGCKWLGQRRPSFRKLGKAIEALDGSVVAAWVEEDH